MKQHFKFGDKVTHQRYGLGLVIGNNKLVRVIFEGGVITGFYEVKVDSRDNLISELVPASDWIEIDWGDESTWPELNQKVLALDEDRLVHSCVFSEDFEEAAFICDGNDGMDLNLAWHVTHWQPQPQPPK